MTLRYLFAIFYIVKPFYSINSAPTNSSAAANNSDKFCNNFIHKINSSAQYYSRKYGKT